MNKIFLPVLAAIIFSCNINSVSNTQQNTAMDTLQKEWILNTNIYEVNVRQYTQEGTFNAFAKELPRLKEMGVEVLWFMPVTPIAQKNKKGVLGSYYAAQDYTSINPEFGNMQDFKNLVKQAHQLGMKVIIDWVANHTGWDHVWTKQHPEYYLIDSATNDFKIASGMDDIIELDFSNPNLRNAMIDAMEFWVREANIDGFRADLAFWVELDFWKEAKAKLDQVKPLFWLGELDPLDNPEYMKVFDAAYTWKWMHETQNFYQKHQSVDSLDNLLVQYRNAPGIKAWFTTNHDENSWNGTEFEKYGDAANALAVFSSTWPGVPLIYSGQELPNKKRLEFFQRDPIEWTGKNELHEFYKTLFNLRKNNPALKAKGTEVHQLSTKADDKVFAFMRKAGEKEVVVLLNLSKQPANISLNERVNGSYRNIFTGATSDLSSQTSFQMQPWEYMVFEK